jgi:hypothetical protein
MDEFKLLQLEQSGQNLLDNWPNAGQREWTEFVLFQKIVEILFEHFEDQTSVIFVLETFIGPNKIEFFCIFIAQSRQN